MPINARPLLLCLPALFAAQGCILIPFTEPDVGAERAVQTLTYMEAGASGPRYADQYESGGRGRVAANDKNSERLAKYISQMEGGTPVVRAHAAYWLGEMGPTARPAVPVLIRNLKHENHWVRRASAKALGKIGGDSVVPALQSSLKDSNQFVAHSAANALRHIGTPAAQRAVRSYRGI